jgi:hypothetical protein
MMDPVSAAIIGAVTAGVMSGVTKVGKKVVVDAYETLKTVLRNKFGSESNLVEAVNHLEKNPDAKARQGGVEEEVQALRADQDQDVLATAQALIEALKSTPEGLQAMSKFQVDVAGGQVGVIGDHTRVEGGIHFGKPTATSE